MTIVLDQPLRTRERAAVEAARAALRKIVQSDEQDADEGMVRAMAAVALERIATILGERK